MHPCHILQQYLASVGYILIYQKPFCMLNRHLAHSRKECPWKGSLKKQIKLEVLSRLGMIIKISNSHNGFGMEREIRKPSSHSVLICRIHFLTNSLAKDSNSTLLPLSSLKLSCLPYYLCPYLGGGDKFLPSPKAVSAKVNTRLEFELSTPILILHQWSLCYTHSSLLISVHFINISITGFVGFRFYYANKVHYIVIWGNIHNIILLFYYIL